MRLTPLLVLAAALPTLASAHPTADLRARLRLADAISARPALLSVVVRFSAPLSGADMQAIEGDGVAFQRVEGRVRNVGGLYGLRVTRDGLARLEAMPGVLSVMPATPRMTSPLPAPLGDYNQIHGLTTADLVWPLRDSDGNRLTGAGRLVADIDSGIDIFHPQFFRADGGLQAWVDVDGNGALDPGTDGVDLDGDGAIAPEEVLQLLDCGMADIYSGGILGQDGGYEPGFDWLYLDSDGNGRRDAGPLAGFTEHFPAYGEPLFTADDVDGSGAVEGGEKLLRLKTSKIRAVMIVGTGKVFRRGVDLINAPVKPQDSMHGTGVAGIILGGELGSKVHGVAPDAELLMIDHSQTGAGALGGDPWGDLVSAIGWARDEGADMVVHEYGTQFGEFADGGSDWEAMLDTLSEEGLVQVTATHNFAGYAGHAMVTVPAGGQVDLPISAMDGTPYGITTTSLIVTVRWRGAPSGALTLSVTTPDGETFPLAHEGGTPPGWVVIGEGDDSKRGTALVVAYVVNAKSSTSVGPLPSGSYTLHIESGAAASLQVHASIGDDTGYAYTVHFDTHATDLGTIAFPSTADEAISVGASVGNEKSWGEQDLGIKMFSGRGPRIDGVLGIDVVAPEDHYTAYPLQKPGQVAYTRFGGTSGALPQVAGALALLQQAQPGLTPGEQRQLVHDRGGVDGITGSVPNDDWGYGRLQTYRLVMGGDPPANQGPKLVLEVGPAAAGVPVTLDASGSTDPDHTGADLTWRWDLGYDGEWDAELAGPTVEATFDAPGRYVAKVEVEDPLGYTDTRLVGIEVAEAPPEPEPGEDVGALPGGSDAGAGAEVDVSVEPGADASVAGGADAAGSADGTSGGSTGGASSDGGGCSTGPGAPGAGGLLGALLAMAWATRRRVARRGLDESAR